MIALNLSDIRGWLAGRLPVGDTWFGAGKMEARRERALCLFARRRGILARHAVSGEAGYAVMPLSLAIRGGDEHDEAEGFANSLYAALDSARFELLGASCFVKKIHAAPLALGTDRRGIYEFSVDFDLYYSTM